MSSRATAAKKRAAQTVQKAPVAAPAPWFKSEGFVLGCLLVIATVAVYFPVSHHPFINLDDPVYVANNPHLSGLDWDTISWSFTTFYQFNWHPVTWISHAADVQFFQRDPGGHHVTNMLLQAANVLLLFWVLRRATGYVGRSAMVAALFALHPVNVESVAWISERKNLLSMFFFLLGMAAYRWYVSASDSKQRGEYGTPNIGRYAVMTLCFVLGLMAKPQIITFPFLLLLWDYWPLERIASRLNDSGSISGEKRMANGEWRSFLWLVKEKIPLFAICAASAIVTVAAQKAGGAIASLQNYPPSVRLTNAIVAFARYIGKAIWPTKLAPLYPHPWHPLPLSQVIPALLLLIAITAAVVAARSRRYLLVGWLWFLGALVPMIGIVHVGNQAMADRYAYLPFIGLFLMVCWGVADFAASRHVPVMAVRVVSVIVLLALAVVTHRQLGYWGDNVALWNHTLAVTEDNYIIHDNLAILLMEQGRTDEALQHYHAALAIYPSDPNSLLALAVYNHQHGQLQDAIACYQKMVSITPPGPARAELLSNEGLVYFDMNDDANARTNFEKAVAMDPQNVRGWLGMGMLAERAGELNAAIENYKHANAVKPLRMTYMMLAGALQKAGNTTEAQAARERARLLSGEEKTTHTYSGGILQQ